MFDTVFKTADVALDQWETWLHGLRNIVGLFSNFDARQRFVAVCITRPRVEDAAAGSFQTDCPSVVHWRWGILPAVLDWLLPRERWIRAA